MDCLFGIALREFDAFSCSEFRICKQESLAITVSYKVAWHLCSAITEAPNGARQHYLLFVLILKCMQGLATHHVSNDVIMRVDTHEYDTKSTEIWRYIER